MMVSASQCVRPTLTTAIYIKVDDMKQKDDLPQMPQYSQTITAPPGEGVYYYLYLRYYSPWNDGARGPVQKEQVYWPEVTLTSGGLSVKGVERVEPYVFSGSVTLLSYFFMGTTEEQEIVVKGYFEQVGYCSLSLYHDVVQNGEEYLTEVFHAEGQDFAMLEGDNPFIPGNPSVLLTRDPLYPTHHRGGSLGKSSAHQDESLMTPG